MFAFAGCEIKRADADADADVDVAWGLLLPPLRGKAGMGGLLPVFFRSASRSTPPATDFLLSGQEKVSKEKATPVPRSCGLPCAARHIGRLRNSSLSLHDKDSDSARRHPLMYLCCSAALRGKRKPDGLQLLAKNIDRVVLTKEDTTMWLTEISIWLPSSVQRAGRLFHSGFYDRCWYWLERWSL